MLRKGFLPSKLPADPMPLVAQWLAQAREHKIQPNPDSMVVASATPDGQPSARVRAAFSTPAENCASPGRCGVSSGCGVRIFGAGGSDDSTPGFRGEFRRIEKLLDRRAFRSGC